MGKNELEMINCNLFFTACHLRSLCADSICFTTYVIDSPRVLHVSGHQFPLKILGRLQDFIEVTVEGFTVASNHPLGAFEIPI